MQYEGKAIARLASTPGASPIEVAECGASINPGAGRGARILGFAYSLVAYVRRATAMGNAAKRNFILQQGFEEPAPAACPLQYSALVFQPKIVLIGVVAGILFQSQVVFAGLGALLWWSALFPKLNPFRALYNQTIGKRPGTSLLDPSPAPRRAAETEAGTIALTSALLIHAGFYLAAYVVEAVFLAAGLAVLIGSFCTGTFVYHLLRGRWRFALQTLPWADTGTKSGVEEGETVVGSQGAPRLGVAGAERGVAPAAGRAKRILVFTYGTTSYAITLGIFAYAAGFIGNFGVPKAMDSGREAPLAQAIAIDALLLGVFAIQHSVMARGGFKRWLTRFIPQAAERSTYVLASNVLMILLFWLWQPIGGTVWNVEDSSVRAVLYGIYAAGWALLLFVTFLINHFDLFGMRQVWHFLRGREMPPLKFVTPGPYKLVRHPLYVGWFTIFWATPTMTAAHLLFAVLTTAYILVAIQFEERDLVTVHGQAYAEYRKRVPMLIPRLFGKESGGSDTVANSTAGRSACATTTQAGGA